MIIKINLSEMTHLKDKSKYNYNFYSHGNMGLELLQICDEYFNNNDYYLVDGDKKILLGSTDYDEEEIEFMYKYT
tara:strand:+ start:627 stop:851 length:225 start_codon:yes stop_codon:yes gene_type:complete